MRAVLLARWPTPVGYGRTDGLRLAALRRGSRGHGCGRAAAKAGRWSPPLDGGIQPLTSYIYVHWRV